MLYYVKIYPNHVFLSKNSKWYFKWFTLSSGAKFEYRLNSVIGKITPKFMTERIFMCPFSNMNNANGLFIRNFIFLTLETQVFRVLVNKVYYSFFKLLFRNLTVDEVRPNYFKRFRTKTRALKKAMKNEMIFSKKN